MTDYFSTVERAYAQLKAEGQPMGGAIGDEAASNQQKGLLNARAGWLIFSQQNNHIGLLSKPGGANYMGVSTDVLLEQSTGDYADTCTTQDHPETGQFTVVPTWNADHDPALIPRWVEPTQALAGLPDGTEPPGPEPGPEPEPPGDDVLQAILVALVAIQASCDRIEAQNLKTHAQNDQIGAYLIKLGQQTSSFKLLGQTVTIHPNPIA